MVTTNERINFMLANLNGWHAVIILAVILLLFGAPKIPMLAKSLGQSMKIFKNEIKSDAMPRGDESAVAPSATTSADQPTTAPIVQ
jgi:sec-independent protein translocase protein TatA